MSVSPVSPRIQRVCGLAGLLLLCLLAAARLRGAGPIRSRTHFHSYGYADSHLAPRRCIHTQIHSHAAS